MSEQMMNNAGSEEVSGTNTNPNERGINMTSTPKTRGPYNGSSAHGVTADVEHVKTITAYVSAVKRLDKRQAYLIGKYGEIRTDYMGTEDVSARAILLKSKASMEAQIKAVIKTRKTLSSIKSEIEETERVAQAAAKFIDFDAA